VAEPYPTPETLKEIACWPMGDYSAMMDYVRAAWADAGKFEGPKYVPPPGIVETERVEADWYRLATGGWSGNENIVSAMQDNLMFWAIAWEASFRGGLTILRIPEGNR